MRAFLLFVSLFALQAHGAGVPLRQDRVQRVEVSSTSTVGAEPMHAEKLFDGHEWSAWGSHPDDGAGAWVKVHFRGVQYVSSLEFVPGAARNAGTFKACGRPARLVVRVDGDERRFDLEDERWKQSVDFDPPIAGGALFVGIDQVHGGGRMGGVCISELRLRRVVDPARDVPGLKERIQLSIEDLADDLRGPHAQKALRRIGPPALPRLQAALDPSNPNLCARVLETLGDIGDPQAARVVAPLAEHPDHQIRTAALGALGALGSAEHVDAIRAWYDRATGTDKDDAFRALVRSGDPRALEVVVAELVGGNRTRRDLAAQNLGRYGDAAIEAVTPLFDSGVDRERAAALHALASVEHPDAEDLLRRALTHADSDERAAAVTALARRGGVDAHARIATRWDSRYPRERAAVARALGLFADPGDLEILELLTLDGAMSVREAAAESLGRYGKRAWPILKRLALSGPDGATASAAARALLESGQPGFGVKLPRARHEEVRGLAADHLEGLGERGRFALVQAVTGKQDRDRAAAADLLRKMGPRALPDLLSAATGAPAAALPEVFEVVAAYADPMAVEFAARHATGAEDLTVRVAAIRALQRCASAAEATHTLFATLADPSVEVRLATIEALGALQIPQATEPLLARLQDPDRPTRRAAARALGLIQQRTALAALVDAYQTSNRVEEDPALREDLVVAIGRIGGRASLKILFEAVNDRDARVAAAAARALQ